MTNNLLRELLISSWKKHTFQTFPLAKTSTFFSLGFLLLSEITSFWEPYFSASPLLSRTPSTTVCVQKHMTWSANWWLVYTSLLLEDLGCGTLVQSRCYQNLSVCTGCSSRLLFESQKFGFRSWFSTPVFCSLLVFKLKFLLSPTTARKDFLLGIILHKLLFPGVVLQIERRLISACLILCSSQ